ncbi:MAG: M56 family metallopeptidase [Lachnospiraceae bacterium]|nr:M56 family metallopeptidase [Lachnospiraceae bacterium]
MKYLLIMSLSGSTMVGIYMLLRGLLRDKMSARLQYLFVKAAILYYLIPLPFVKRWYINIAEHLQPERKSIAQASAAWAGYMVHANEKIYINGYMKIQIIIIVIWLAFATLWLSCKINDYCKTRKRVLDCADQIITKEESSFLERLKEQCGVERKVTVYQDNISGRSITFGFLKPVILCDQKPGSPDAELILCHELIHIKRWDVWWKVLVQCVILLHWWNPAAWIMYRDFERTCEWSCDEIVVQDRTKDEIKRYLKLMILESTKVEEGEKKYQRWAAGFGTKAEKIKKRMDNVMKMRKWNKSAAGAVVAVLVAANSLTALAYEDTIHEGLNRNMSQAEVEYFMEGQTWQYIPKEVEVEVLEEADSYIPYNNDIRYDDQFVDADGRIYPTQDEGVTGVYWGCNHNYEPGTRVMHDKKSDGSCLVKVYDAERCSKCGFVLVGDFISETRYAKCPH